MYCQAQQGVEVKKVITPICILKKVDIIIEAAYQAVDQAFYKPTYRQLCKHNTKHIDDIWAIGPKVIFKKTRIVPVVLLRQMLAYYLYEQGLKHGNIANMIGGFHRTTVLTGCHKFKDRKNFRFDTVEKAVYEKFCNILSIND